MFRNILQMQELSTWEGLERDICVIYYVQGRRATESGALTYRAMSLLKYRTRGARLPPGPRSPMELINQL